MDPARRGRPPELTSVERRPPDDPLVGWRYWQFQPAATVLRSVTHRRVVWQPRRVQRAVCLIGGHDAPAPGCACGIHAAADLTELRANGLCLSSADPLVAGQVALWGSVVADAHGLRSELAYPARLFLVAPAGGPDTAATRDRLAAFGVPVGTMAPDDAVGEVMAAVLQHQSISR